MLKMPRCHSLAFSSIALKNKTQYKHQASATSVHVPPHFYSHRRPHKLSFRQISESLSPWTQICKKIPLTFLLSKYNRYLHIFPPILHAYSPFCFSITLGARHFHTGPAECVKAAGQQLILRTCPRQTGSDTGCHILYSIFSNGKMLTLQERHFVVTFRL